MLQLYGTEGCHLCHDAQTLLQRMGVTWTDVDIIDDDALLERYGMCIPVLQQQARELHWPFNEQDVVQFLQTPA